MTEHDVMNEVFQILSIVKHDKKMDKMYLEDDARKPLTGREMGFNAREMTYVALEVMKRFHIQLTSEDVIDYAFNSVEKITRTILRKLSEGG